LDASAWWLPSANQTAASEREVLNCDGIFLQWLPPRVDAHIARAGRHESRRSRRVRRLVFLAEFTPVIRDLAGRLSPSSLRTLDAIHVATAAGLDLPDLVHHV
jgi:hypothetical protein